MNSIQQVLLIGDTGMMAITEAALREVPTLNVRRVDDRSEISGEWNAIFIEDSLPREEVLEIMRSNPGALLIILHWKQSSFTLLVGHKDHSLTIEQITHVLETGGCAK
jgi:hypothetical protein